MPDRSPRQLSPAKRRSRQRRIRNIARDLEFAGRIEYRHVYSQTGGAQYGQGRTAAEDLLVVYAEAFDRDSDPDDFSLSAIIAHERGHQLLARHARIARLVAGRVSTASEEILASLLGAMISQIEADRDALVGKATAELLIHEVPPAEATARLQELWNLLEGLL